MEGTRMTVFLILAVLALIASVVSAMNKCPCWVASVLISVALLLLAIPAK
jgi:hypothetical protein